MTSRGYAFIPARSGSKRLPGKNLLPLLGHPLIAYTISAAIQASVFERILVITDDENYADVALYYGAEVPCLRPPSTATDTAPDLLWLKWICSQLSLSNSSKDYFVILRPTNPFRDSSMIKRGIESLLSDPSADSVRAVTPCTVHPSKMWRKMGNYLTPLLPFDYDGVPWHSNQYCKLPLVYQQTASLEVSWLKNVLVSNSISGDIILPLLSSSLEAIDINTLLDLQYAELVASMNPAALPPIFKALHPAYETK